MVDGHSQQKTVFTWNISLSIFSVRNDTAIKNRNAASVVKKTGIPHSSRKSSLLNPLIICPLRDASAADPQAPTHDRFETNG